jgi:hypothetical protein
VFAPLVSAVIGNGERSWEARQAIIESALPSLASVIARFAAEGDAPTKPAARPRIARLSSAVAAPNTPLLIHGRDLELDQLHSILVSLTLGSVTHTAEVNGSVGPSKSGRRRG